MGTGTAGAVGSPHGQCHGSRYGWPKIGNKAGCVGAGHRDRNIRGQAEREGMAAGGGVASTHDGSILKAPKDGRMACLARLSTASHSARVGEDNAGVVVPSSQGGFVGRSQL
ncbi:hypothetical protein BDW22DRAFT_1363437 [Trametopsis cervina]|nr:hypothetical protein BDW22DRAFT_1363437 [Trametopsis cervina]